MSNYFLFQNYLFLFKNLFWVSDSCDKKKKNLHITDEISKKYCDKCFEKKQPFSYLFPLITQEKGDIPEDNIPEIDAKECMILQGTDMPVKPMSTR